MPELPEVEVTRRALAPALTGRRFVKACFYCDRLRKPLLDLSRLQGLKLHALERRSKYLIWTFVNGKGEKRYLLSHLGMSGSWRLWQGEMPQRRPHDRVDLVFDGMTARLTDPRKFSDISFFQNDPRKLPPLNALGVEPLSVDFTAQKLYEGLHKSKRTVKSLLLDGRVVVGCGNIYANESLFAARILPTRPGNTIRREEAESLYEAIVDVLQRALQAGGTTLRDFHGATGETGWFALQCEVYGREGESCPRCGQTVRRLVQNGRSSFFCSRCQS